jgi:hypothetical protein
LACTLFLFGGTGMARDARRKERHRLKRKQKQLAQRKAKGVTALQKVALGGGTLECYVNPPEWQEEGIASILVLAKTAGGRCTLAGFLVDLWCVGLKDAWGRSETPADHLQDTRDNALSRGAVRMSEKEARRLVAGAVRFSRESGFRLPDHWQKWVSIFGEMGPLESLDMSDFGVEGEGRGKKLRYVGTEQFLRTRLMGSTMEAFVARPDVEVLIGAGPPLAFDDDDYADEDEDEALDETPDEAAAAMADMIRETSARTAGGCRKWCFAQGVVPHRLLEEAVQLMIVGLMPAMAYEDGVARGEIEPAEDPPDRLAPVKRALAEYPPEERREMEAALEQVTRFIQSFSDPIAMLEAMGVKPLEEESPSEEEQEGRAR